jgi:hypothetical protein
LDQKDKATLGADRKISFNAQVFTRCLEAKKKDCESQKRTLFTKSDGTEVKIRDVLEKIASWIRRFEPIGDAVAQFDPVHAALPWAGVKFLIEVSAYYLGTCTYLSLPTYMYPGTRYLDNSLGLSAKGGLRLLLVNSRRMQR